MELVPDREDEPEFALGDSEYLLGELPVDRALALEGEFVLGGLWGKLGGFFKKAAKVVWKFGKKALKNKAVCAALDGAGAAVGIPPPMTSKVLKGAVATIDQATHKDSKVAAPAVATVKAVRDKAATGDPDAKETLAMLQTVRDAQKEAAREGPVPASEAPAAASAAAGYEPGVPVYSLKHGGWGQVEYREGSCYGVRFPDGTAAVVCGGEILLGGGLEEGLQYLHQVWPLIQGGRASQATLERAAETARSLRQEFRGPNLDSEEKVFLDEVLERLRDYLSDAEGSVRA